MNKKTRKVSVSRHPGQRILIGDDIVVRISKIEGGRVQVFIKTPEDIAILRPDKDADQLDRELARSGHNFDRDENE